MQHYSDTLVDQFGKPAVVASDYSSTKYAENYTNAVHGDTYAYDLPDHASFIGETNSYSLWSRDDLRAAILSIGRLLENKDANVRSIVDRVSRYSIGSGIRPESLCEEYGKEVDEYWEEWCKNAEVAGHSFYTAQDIICKRVVVDGDVGITFTENGKIRLIDSYQYGGFDSDKRVVGGVKVDRNGTPIAYHVNLKQAPPSPLYGAGSPEIYSNFFSLDDTTPVPANRFFVVFKARYPTQLRGLSAFVAAISDAYDIKHLVNLEKIAVKIQSAFATIEKTQDPKKLLQNNDRIPGDNTPQQEKRPNSNYDIAGLPAGLMKILAEGEEFKGFEATRPAAKMIDFVEYLGRRFANSVGIPYEIALNPSKITSPSQRSINQDAENTFISYQNMMIEKACEPVYKHVIRRAVIRRELPAAPDIFKVKWIPPNARPIIDRGHEVKADSEALIRGSTSFKEVCRRKDMDWKEVREQREIELDDQLERATRISKKHDIPLETAMQYIASLDLNSVEEAPVNNEQNEQPGQ